MPVDVMMFGGHRDGQILNVPGYLEPQSKTIKMTMKRTEENPNPDPLILEIVPRKAATGPAWKIILPKELW